MSAANQIRIEQEKLDQIRRDTERRMSDEWKEILDKVNARKDAHREGHLDEDKASEDWKNHDEKKLGEQRDRAQLYEDQIKRERQQKADQTKSDEQKQSDQRKADQQKKDDQQQEDLRAAARSKARDETEKLVKEGLEKHVQERQERIMSGASSGPSMTPGTVNDPLRMAAALDHPGLSDDQKLILSNAGYAVGEGWHNREAERKEQLMQSERGKRDDLRAAQDRDDAVDDAKENSRKDHEDQQVGETGKDIKERADLESTGKVSVKEAEEMTHGKGSKAKADQQFDEWFTRNKDQELDKQGVSQDAKDYERENER